MFRGVTDYIKLCKKASFSNIDEGDNEQGDKSPLNRSSTTLVVNFFLNSDICCYKLYQGYYPFMSKTFSFGIVYANDDEADNLK